MNGVSITSLHYNFFHRLNLNQLMPYLKKEEWSLEQLRGNLLDIIHFFYSLLGFANMWAEYQAAIFRI